MISGAPGVVANLVVCSVNSVNAGVEALCTCLDADDASEFFSVEIDTVDILLTGVFRLLFTDVCDICTFMEVREDFKGVLVELL